MKKLELSRLASHDLADILRYTRATWGTQQMRAYSRTLDEGFVLLQESPMIGKGRPDIGKGMRFFPVAEHVLFYTVTGDVVRIARILHSRMDLKNRVRRKRPV